MTEWRTPPPRTRHAPLRQPLRHTSSSSSTQTSTHSVTETVALYVEFRIGGAATLRRMVQSEATTPQEYLASLPDERRTVIDAVRQVILANLHAGFEEGVEFGMLSYHVPLADFGDTYNGRPIGIAALANQKNHMAVYLMGIYGDESEKAWFTEAWTATGTKLDMGKSCVRFKNLDGVALDVLGQAISRVTPDDLIALHRAAHGS